MTEYNSEQFDFAAFFASRLKERGLSVKKLSELSGISQKDLQNLSEGDFDNLPPAPYLRGYTIKLSKILEFDPELWWNYFVRIGAVKASGHEDTLPVNRFAITKGRRYGLVVAVIVVVLVYGGLRFSKILGRPTLIISEPGEGIARVKESNITVRGTIEDADNLFINGTLVEIKQDGTWQKNVVLEPGLNTVEFRARKLLGRETDALRQILYEPDALPDNSSTTSEPVSF
jgi:hypothetical protein